MKILVTGGAGFIGSAFVRLVIGNRPDIELGEMPRHMFEPESLRDSLSRALPDFVLMISLIIVFLIGAYVSFLRYDVR